MQLRIAPDGKQALLVRYTVKGSNTECKYRLPQENGGAAVQLKLLPHAQKPGASVPWLDNASTGESPEDAKESRAARGTVHGPAA